VKQTLQPILDKFVLDTSCFCETSTIYLSDCLYLHLS